MAKRAKAVPPRRISLKSWRSVRMRKEKPFVRHHGVAIYQTFKGRDVLSYWYALEPGHNEGTGEKFDIRRLPKAYRHGLMIDYHQMYDFTSLLSGPDIRLSESDVRRFEEALQAERNAHKIALQRAIDDDYSFASAIRDNYAQPFRRFLRYIRRSFARHRTS